MVGGLWDKFLEALASLQAAEKGSWQELVLLCWLVRMGGKSGLKEENKRWHHPIPA